jgi:hypothetical protein
MENWSRVVKQLSQSHQQVIQLELQLERTFNEDQLREPAEFISW